MGGRSRASSVYVSLSAYGSHLEHGTLLEQVLDTSFASLNNNRTTWRRYTQIGFDSRHTRKEEVPLPAGAIGSVESRGSEGGRVMFCPAQQLDTIILRAVATACRLFPSYHRGNSMGSVRVTHISS